MPSDYMEHSLESRLRKSFWLVLAGWTAVLVPARETIPSMHQRQFAGLLLKTFW